MNTEEIILSHVENARCYHIFESSYVVPDHITNNFPHEHLMNARKNHELDLDKRVYFIINILGTGNSILILLNGLSIATEKWFSCDNIFIEWEKIKEVKVESTVSDGKTYLYLYFDKNIPEKHYKVYLNYEADIIFKFIRELTNAIRENNSKESQKVEELYTEAKNSYDNKDDLNALTNIENGLEQSPYNYNLRKLKSLILFKSGKYDESIKELGGLLNAINYISTAINSQFTVEDNNAIAYLKIIEALNYKEKEDYYSSYWAYKESLLYLNDNKDKDIVERELSSVLDNLNIEIKKLDYKKRKLLYFTDDGLMKKPTNFIAISTDSLKEIKFQLGHPINGEFYVGHPHRSEIYYHINDYERILFQDKVMELNHILECLGAKSINIECIKDEKVHDNKNEQDNIEVGVSIVRGMEGGLKTSNDKTIEKEIGSKMLTSQEFELPSKYPFVPEKMLWYNHETTWQSLAYQRQNGNLTKSSITISSTDMSILSSNELTNISAELKGLLFKAKGSYQNEINLNHKIEQNTEWKINIEFYPKSEIEENLANVKLITNDTIKILADNEVEYQNYYSECLKGGNIDPSDRKLLDRLQLRLNISDNRKTEIETIINDKVQFNESENVYYNEVLFCLEDDGIISEEERKYLNSKKARLSLSDDRATEIEELALIILPKKNI